MKTLGSLLIALALTAASFAFEIHMSPNGDDTADGTAAAPLKSFPAVLERLKGWHADGDVEVVMQAGVYHVEEPIVVGPEHQPAGCKILFRAARGAWPSISGGRKITGWAVDENGAWTTEIPEVKQGEWRFRELFVNSAPATRARHPNEGYFRIEKSLPDRRSGFTFKPGDIPAAANGAELVFLHDWSMSRIDIASIDEATHTLKTKFSIGPSAAHYAIDHFEPHPRYYLENSLALLDQPGEWYLDEASGKLTYLPREGETLENTEFIAPAAKQLVVVRGTDKKPVCGVRFEFIEFQHAAWPLPAEGYASSQATMHEARDASPRSNSRGIMPAAILFEMAENCSIVDGRIANIGCSGVWFGSRTKNCFIERCLIEDISGNGVNIGEDRNRRVDGKPWSEAAPQQIARGNRVENCVIRRTGRQFFGSIGVWVAFAAETKVVHNEITDLPYSGVSVGWLWNPTPTPVEKNVVEANHIHHVMQKLSDGGGIYTLGRQPGTRLAGNHIHDIPLNAGRAESNGMFLDEGSDQITIEGNLIYNIDRSPLRFHKAQEMFVRRNVLVCRDAAIPPLRYNSTNPETIEQTDNVVLTADKFDLATYEKMVAGSGVEQTPPFLLPRQY
ncbi:right-handed parallel beta-helix repeat-containing protein [Blastopirellula sp. JC732]|uniref:Right-handed parallel beta-helix repeat-containing protein n=1 Tax=Blastopirellula sediminis TaxID=2894196 RepID=A0A9X1MLU7_9BACT|nr:right-handed parallel beta-helix repeat-containing protein [Blastopirellula sediminis]MCC9607274.1 right-handed parallel beta-helix repeat-containing protein [Blastopirellula sediminis]MCC9629433.1 right-handed parallel beta-helix repeat-containing protein [Blastopirellula sediminis]